MDELEKNLRDFEDAVEGLVRNISALVDVLGQPLGIEAPGPVAERLTALGSAAIPALSTLLDSENISEATRFYAAWVAIRVGDRGESVEVLRAVVDQDSSFSVSAAAALGRHRIVEARPVISRALDRASARGDMSVPDYSAALRDVGGMISTEALEQIRSNGPSWYLKAVEMDFPSSIQPEPGSGA